MTTIIATALLILLAAFTTYCWIETRDRSQRCTVCRRRLDDGGYIDIDTEDRYCSMVCAYEDEAVFVRWTTIGLDESEKIP